MSETTIFRYCHTHMGNEALRCRLRCFEAVLRLDASALSHHGLQLLLSVLTKFHVEREQNTVFIDIIYVALVSSTCNGGCL